MLSIAVAALAALSLAGCMSGSGSGGGPYGGSGGGGGSSSAPSSSGASGSSASGSLATATTPLGTIVVNGSKMTVYVFDQDTVGEKSSACTGSCITTWPAVTSASATPTATGVTGTLGTIPAPDGKLQVTLNGYPLYTYVGDSAAGDITGQGLQGTWWVVSPSGTKITAAPQKGY
ncbi:MAG: hypothetical protein EPN48_04755 [Microbacteriaceae bacterium]|nr:MAG: hypothetical protein EPN48_04755 [Microbacteriaceae bacterium]